MARQVSLCDLSDELLLLIAARLGPGLYHLCYLGCVNKRFREIVDGNQQLWYELFKLNWGRSRNPKLFVPGSPAYIYQMRFGPIDQCIENNPTCCWKRAFRDMYLKGRQYDEEAYLSL